MRRHQGEPPWNTLAVDKNLKKYVLSFGLLDVYIIITKAFGLPKPGLFSNYKVMLLLFRLRVN